MVLRLKQSRGQAVDPAEGDLFRNIRQQSAEVTYIVPGFALLPICPFREAFCEAPEPSKGRRGAKKAPAKEGAQPVSATCEPCLTNRLRGASPHARTTTITTAPRR